MTRTPRAPPQADPPATCGRLPRPRTLLLSPKQSPPVCPRLQRNHPDRVPAAPRSAHTTADQACSARPHRPSRSRRASSTGQTPRYSVEPLRSVPLCRPQPRAASLPRAAAQPNPEKPQRHPPASGVGTPPPCKRETDPSRRDAPRCSARPEPSNSPDHRAPHSALDTALAKRAIQGPPRPRASPARAPARNSRAFHRSRRSLLSRQRV